VTLTTKSTSRHAKSDGSNDEAIVVCYEPESKAANLNSNSPNLDSSTNG